MKGLSLGILMVAVTACTVERVGPPGVALTRPVRVKASEVRMFEAAAMVPGQLSVVDDLDIKDDGTETPRALEKRLRELAGGRGANAVILDPLNRKPNGTRVVTGLTLDNPFKHFRGTAIWIGDGPRPVIDLGTLGGKER
jgi:hypothetical protein